jgi:ABC-type amino acid transport substrate-binding protein
MKARGLAVLFYLLCSAPGLAGTLEDVRSSGVLQCGVDHEVPGFSAAQKDGLWSGLSVDFCRALATVVIGDGQKVNFTVLEPAERFEALQSGEIDVLVAALPINAGLEGENGVLFVDPLYFHPTSSGFAAFSPLVRQSDDQWFLTVKWLRHLWLMLDLATATGREPAVALGPVISAQHFVPESLILLQNMQSGYAASLVRNFGAEAARAPNKAVSQGGWLWVPDF